MTDLSWLLKNNAYTSYISDLLENSMALNGCSFYVHVAQRSLCVLVYLSVLWLANVVTVGSDA